MMSSNSSGVELRRSPAAAQGHGLSAGLGAQATGMRRTLLPAAGCTRHTQRALGAAARAPDAARRAAQHTRIAALDAVHQAAGRGHHNLAALPAGWGRSRGWSQSQGRARRASHAQPTTPRHPSRHVMQQHTALRTGRPAHQQLCPPAAPQLSGAPCTGRHAQRAMQKA